MKGSFSPAAANLLLVLLTGDQQPDQKNHYRGAGGDSAAQEPPPQPGRTLQYRQPGTVTLFQLGRNLAQLAGRPVPFVNSASDRP